MPGCAASFRRSPVRKISPLIGTFRAAAPLAQSAVPVRSAASELMTQLLRAGAFVLGTGRGAPERQQGFGEHVPGPMSMPPLCWHARGAFNWHFAAPPTVRQHWIAAGVEAILLGGSAAVSQKKAVAARSVRGTVDMTASVLRADEVRV